MPTPVRVTYDDLPLLDEPAGATTAPPPASWSSRFLHGAAGAVKDGLAGMVEMSPIGFARQAADNWQHVSQGEFGPSVEDVKQRLAALGMGLREGVSNVLAGKPESLGALAGNVGMGLAIGPRVPGAGLVQRPAAAIANKAASVASKPLVGVGRVLQAAERPFQFDNLLQGPLRGVGVTAGRQIGDAEAAAAMHRAAVNIPPEYRLSARPLPDVPVANAGAGLAGLLPGPQGPDVYRSIGQMGQGLTTPGPLAATPIAELGSALRAAVAGPDTPPTGVLSRLGGSLRTAGAKAPTPLPPALQGKLTGIETLDDLLSRGLTSGMDDTWFNPETFYQTSTDYLARPVGVPPASPPQATPLKRAAAGARKSARKRKE